MSEPVRHHYLPIFYLMPWIGADNRLCEYSRPYKETKPFRKHPAATGYVDGLYTVPGLPPDQAQYVEREFMKANDDWAAKAQQILLSSTAKPDDLDARMAVAWARFLYSLMIRNPENLLRLKEKAAALEMKEPTEALLPSLINSERVITEIVKEMQFHTITIHDLDRAFLTSDRPIIMTNGLKVENAHIVIPISPTRLFLASRSVGVRDYLHQMKGRELTAAVNNKVAEQARKFVYGMDDSQFRFIAKRLGKAVSSTPLD